MSRRLLVPLTGSEQAWPALEYTLQFFPGADITVLTVIDPAGAGYGQRSDDRSREEATTDDARAERLFEAATERAEDYGTAIDTAIAEGQPAQSIVEFAKEHDVDGIVLGTESRSDVSEVLLGSVHESDALVSQSEPAGFQ